MVQKGKDQRILEQNFMTTRTAYQAGMHCHFNFLSWNVLSEKRAAKILSEAPDDERAVMERNCDPGYRRELFRQEFERLSKTGGGNDP